METINLEIRTFISKFFGKVDFTDSDNLSELGFVNSLFAMQLVMFIEKRFNIQIENEEMDFKNFSSVEAISNLIATKTKDSVLK